MSEQKTFVLDDFVRKVATGYADILEERIKIVIKPKPRFTPLKLWYWLAAKFLVVEHHHTPSKVNTKEEV